MKGFIDFNTNAIHWYKTQLQPTLVILLNFSTSSTWFGN